jgi:hypothetical protein
VRAVARAGFLAFGSALVRLACGVLLPPVKANAPRGACIFIKKKKQGMVQSLLLLFPNMPTQR